MSSHFSENHEVFETKRLFQKSGTESKKIPLHPIDGGRIFRYNRIGKQCLKGAKTLNRAVSASILSADFLHLEDEVRRLEEANVDMLHFDVMDGCFVPNISFGIPVLQAIRKTTGMFLDVHLMIRDPYAYIEEFVKAGADMITFHLESDSDPLRTLERIHSYGCKAGLALKPATPAGAAQPFMEHLDNLLVMTVEPGFGGQSYLHDMNDKIQKAAEMRGSRPCYVQVDGGINAETVQEAIAAGADLLVAGSYLFRHPDLAEGVNALRKSREVLK